eukprot:TRINITY_DN3921_c0_g1_i7.p1 TRINITY_DN3921_c0_g1~~TRINITY_DN3921_c0_g1_i7.p1  ORF type:complete len:363 (-),score=59.04 TRINITY_DN3921_c0_g1_i7:486-1550(-)
MVQTVHMIAVAFHYDPYKACLNDQLLLHLRESIQEYVNIRSCAKYVHELVSLMLSVTTVKVLLKLQNFQPFTFSAALNGLQLSNNETGLNVDPILASLEAISRYLSAFRSKVSNAQEMLKFRITIFSPDCLSMGDSAIRILQELDHQNIRIQFVYLALPDISLNEQTELDQITALNSPLATFALAIRRWTNCTLDRINEDLPSIRRWILVNWIQSSPQIVQLVFKSADVLPCLVSEVLLDDLRIQETKVCVCHGLRINSNMLLKDCCSVSKNFLEDTEIRTAATLGEGPIVIPIPFHPTERISMHVLHKIAQSEINLDLICGKPLRLTPFRESAEFCALARQLKQDVPDAHHPI